MYVCMYGDRCIRIALLNRVVLPFFLSPVLDRWQMPVLRVAMVYSGLHHLDWVLKDHVELLQLLFPVLTKALEDQPPALNEGSTPVRRALDLALT